MSTLRRPVNGYHGVEPLTLSLVDWPESLVDTQRSCASVHFLPHIASLGSQIDLTQTCRIFVRASKL